MSGRPGGVSLGGAAGLDTSLEDFGEARRVLSDAADEVRLAPVLEAEPESEHAGNACDAALMDDLAGSVEPARAGLHTGEQDLGADLLAGIPVSVARNLKERAEPGEVLVSSTVRDLVAGSGLVFREHEEEPLQVEGVPGEWRVHALVA